ncbi:hypothetical protein EVAR_32833_1 [Eumeta japonica]|uniref:Uncharacterized protein n=1 Tax=Eumeta variegata TaxID=151549 RepID=A0A4C1WD91_EUMVA|nr:hypothetical protein EVAR_32833_1 [Eumeta japonica]
MDIESNGDRLSTSRQLSHSGPRDRQKRPNLRTDSPRMDAFGVTRRDAVCNGLTICNVMLAYIVVGLRGGTAIFSRNKGLLVSKWASFV